MNIFLDAPAVNESLTMSLSPMRPDPRVLSFRFRNVADLLLYFLNNKQTYHGATIDDIGARSIIHLRPHNNSFAIVVSRNEWRFCPVAIFGLLARNTEDVPVVLFRCMNVLKLCVRVVLEIFQIVGSQARRRTWMERTADFHAYGRVIIGSAPLEPLR